MPEEKATLMLVSCEETLRSTDKKAIVCAETINAKHLSHYLLSMIEAIKANDDSIYGKGLRTTITIEPSKDGNVLQIGISSKKKKYRFTAEKLAN